MIKGENSPSFSLVASVVLFVCFVLFLFVCLFLFTITVACSLFNCRVFIYLFIYLFILFYIYFTDRFSF